MRLRQLFRKQDGFALIMAVGVLGVLTIAGTTVMVYTASNTRISQRSKVDETSFSLSEAALNNAMAVLSNPTNNALDPDVLNHTEATASSATYENGTAKWCGP
jgi:Tfp pilus assembly protein PilX